MKTKPRVAIFTLTKDRLAYTKVTLDSLDRCTHTDCDHFVVDNGSVDGTVEYLREALAQGRLKKVRFNEQNKGIPVASNQALDMIREAAVDYDFIIKLDNDCQILSDNWLLPLLDIINDLDRTIILSPHVKGIAVSQDGEGVPRFKRMRTRGHELGLVKHFGGICVVAPAEIYDRFRFPVSGFLHGGNDVNFSYYAGRRGYLMGYVEDIEVAHIDSTHGQVVKFPRYFAVRQAHEARAVYGERFFVTQLKRPWRRASQIRKLHHLDLVEDGLVSHVLSKMKKVAAERERSEW